MTRAFALYLAAASFFLDDPSFDNIRAGLHGGNQK